MTTYKVIRAECEQYGYIKPNEHDELVCIWNHFLPCDGYKCPVLHLARGTKPSNILSKLGLEKEFEKDMAV